MFGLTFELNYFPIRLILVFGTKALYWFLKLRSHVTNTLLLCSFAKEL